jgi:UDP-GlcNAc:undecaprenyl-phosphate GlcNAc-1-phosphate transferase
MASLFLIPSLSLLACLLLIPAARRFALKVGLVDRPDGRRKIHNEAVPVTGGLAVFASLWLAIGVAMVFPHSYQEALLAKSDLLLGLFLGSLLLVVIGVADDFNLLRGRHKLVGQVLAIAVVMSFGVNVQSIHIFGKQIDLMFMAQPFTCCLLLGAVNSINLIDGMDGLLGSIGLWLSLALAAMAALVGHWWAVLPALALAGALIGFLRYNLPPASIFLGDAGSMVVGLLLGTLAIQCSLKGPTTVALLLPVGLLTMPFFDTAAAIVRRTLTGRSIYSTDRGHMHHTMLGKGLSTPLVLVVVSVCCIVTSVGVLFSEAFHNEWIIVLTMLSIVSVLVCTRMFGFAEAMLIKKRLISLFQPHKNVSQMEVRLQGSGDWQRLWLLLKGEADRLNLQQMLLDVNAPALHEGYHARWSRFREGDEAPTLWRVEVPLLSAKSQSIGRLVIAGQPDNEPFWDKIGVLMKVVDGYTNGPSSDSVVPATTAAFAEIPNPVSVGA